MAGERNIGLRAERLIGEMLREAGWKVRQPQARASGGDRGADLVASKAGTSYVLQVKATSEGRRDRLIPVWSQAYLQAARAAGGSRSPLAVVVAPRISPRVADQVLSFAAQYAPGAAAGVVDFVGLRMFQGKGLEALNSDRPGRRRSPQPFAGRHANLFSDLNQWMLKVLLAPELPESMLTAPRGRYQNATQLAAAAGVSLMSASRLVRQLQHDGYLHESKPHLELVRREELFRSWRNAAARSPRELPLRLLLRGDAVQQAKRVTEDGEACLALFAAADALGLGFVKGVPPYLYVRRLAPGTLPDWNGMVPARPGETPDLRVREAPATQSVFRGAVDVAGARVCDVVQVWLDVASHPSRGSEQAELIERNILGRVIGRVGGDE